MDTGTLASALPRFRGDQQVISANQDVKEIMKEILEAHQVFARDYDKIAAYFIGGSPLQIAKKLFKFCKKNIPYKIEPVSFQTTRSPGGILNTARLMGGDCKHYASFIGGVLDAISRMTGQKINWWYRFAGYDIFSSVPQHVFVVLHYKGEDYWVDPVLKEFDQRDPDPSSFLDKRIKMNLNGIGCPPAYRIGIVPAVAVALIQAIPGVAAMAVKILGSGKKRAENPAVRELVALYQVNVEGIYGRYNDLAENQEITSGMADQAQLWFSTVLGVPIEDKIVYAYLTGREPKATIFQMLHVAFISDDITLNVPQRIEAYRKYTNLTTADVSDAQLVQAIQIAEWMHSVEYNDKQTATPSNLAGKWANMTVAAGGIGDELIKAYNAANPEAPIQTVNTTNNTNMPDTTTISHTSLSDILEANPVATVGIVAVAGWGLYEATKSKGIGKIDTNTVLLVGAAAAAVFLLTRNNNSNPNQPVYQPNQQYPQYQQYPQGNQPQANVWSFLDSLSDLATNIFVKKPSGYNNPGNNNTYVPGYGSDFDDYSNTV